MDWISELKHWLSSFTESFINCLFIKDMVSCWKTVAVKKSKNDLAVSKAPR